MKKSLLVCLSLTLVLFSCKNFLGSSGLKEEIDQKIEEASTPEVTLKISATNSYGTLTGETGGAYKLNKSYTISFEDNENYQFVRWCVLNEKDEEISCEETDPIFIETPDQLSTTFKILQQVSGYKIQPHCELRPVVSIATPQYQLSGVNRDRAIIITFNQNISLSNFRYSDSEKKALTDDNCELLLDENNSPYGYVKNGVVYFKNVKIRNSNNSSENLLQFFEAPQVNGQILTIQPKKNITERFSLDSSGYKDIEVTVSNINQNGICIYKDYSFTYRASNTTDAQTKVFINASAVLGTITPAGGTYNVGDSFEVSFTENDEYKFVEWQMLDLSQGNQKISITNNTYDSDKGIIKALVTILEGDGNITVSPVCTLRPTITGTSPNYVVSGTDFNSDILLNFGTEIAKDSFVFTPVELSYYGTSAEAVRIDENDIQSDIIAVKLGNEIYFKNISITDQNGKNISSYYKKVEIINDLKTVKITFDESKRFDFSQNPTQDIYVSVSRNVYSNYTTSDKQEIKVYMNEKSHDYDFNFRVKNTTSVKAYVTISVLDTSLDNPVSMGTINMNGEQSFNLGQTVSLVFEPAANYQFLRWSISGNSDDKITFDEDLTKTTLNFTVNGPASGITIKPYCEPLNVSRILFSTPSGSISPSGYENIRRNTTVDLICKPSEKSYFSNWMVINTVTEQILTEAEYKKYFEFEDIKSATTSVKVKFDSSNLSIVAHTYTRPTVYDHDPLNTYEGSNKDQSIRIFITPGKDEITNEVLAKGIDESTLYYTQEEISKIGAGYTLLDGGNEHNHKYYGYYKNGEPDSYVFKNITIVNRSNTSENLLSCYGCPYLQNEEGTIIVIPVDSTNCPANKEILVSLGTDYSYVSPDKKDTVNIYDDKLVFSYKTNNNVDTTKPTIESTIAIRGKNSSGTLYSLKTADVSLGSGEFDGSTYSGYYIKPESDGTVKLNFNISVKDTGLNLQSLYMYYSKIRDNTYTKITKPFEVKVPLKMQNSFGQGQFDSDYTFSNLLKNDGSLDGLYSIRFEAVDGSGNKSDEGLTYYLLVDRYPAQTINDSNYVYFVKNGYVEVRNLSNATEVDAKNTYIQFNDDTAMPITSNNITKAKNNLEKNQDVNIKIITEDYFGNKKTFDSSYNPKLLQKAGASAGMYIYNDGKFSTTNLDKNSIYGVVIDSDYSGDNKNVYVVTDSIYQATPYQIENGILPDPSSDLTKLNSSIYSIPTLTEWNQIKDVQAIIDGLGNPLGSIYNPSKTGIKQTIYVSNGVYNCDFEEYFYFVKDSNTLVIGRDCSSCNGSYNYYYTSSRMNTDFNVKYIITYIDNK